MLPPEPWGKRLQRARETATPPFSQQLAAWWIAGVTMRPIADTTISRLESLDAVPADPRRRRTAYLLAVLYELDPSEIDLTDDDGPGDPAVHALRKARAAHAANGFSTIWYSHHPRMSVLAAAV
jgi:hypothetical protein